MPGHATDAPLQTLALVTQHRNSRVCRWYGERVQMIWRSPSMRCSRDRNVASDLYQHAAGDADKAITGECIS